MNIEGIIVRVTPFRETSAMITLLSKDKLLSFLVKGAYKKKEFNNLISSPLLLANFTFVDDLKTLILKEINPIVDTRAFMNNFSKLYAINLINEFTLSLFDEEDMHNIYPYLKEIIISLKGNDNVLTLLNIYLASCLKLSGLGLNVNSCVRCSKKNNIIAISYSDGGLICKDCFNELTDKLYNANQIKILHYIFNIEISNIAKVSFSINDSKIILKDLIIYASDQSQNKYKNIKLIDNL